MLQSANHASRLHIQQINHSAQIKLLINKTLQSANLASKIPTNTSNLAGLLTT
jgi:hypothetical protein